MPRSSLCPPPAPSRPPLWGTCARERPRPRPVRAGGGSCRRGRRPPACTRPAGAVCLLVGAQGARARRPALLGLPELLLGEPPLRTRADPRDRGEEVVV